MAQPVGESIRVLAIAESDAYVKWAAWTLERLPPGFSHDLIVLSSPTSPSADQLGAALTGTRLDGARPQHVGLASLRRHLRSRRPSVVLLACTGPTVAVVSTIVATLRHRPVVVSGLPGVGLPVRERAIRARRYTDVFLAHSRREVSEYQAAFDALGTATRVALSTLPFLGPATRATLPAADAPIVFAAQPSVPARRSEREQILLALAQLGPPAPIVKLRGREGDAMTHDEPWPYPVLWDELGRSGRAMTDQLRFVEGPIRPVLESARCLVTVSSTAAIEAIALGVPVVVIDDFGVKPELLNEVFVGSGLLRRLTAGDVAAAVAGTPESRWAADNYFHDSADDDWVRVVRTSADAPTRRRRRADGRFLLTVLRRSCRLAMSSLPALRLPKDRASRK